MGSIFDDLCEAPYASFYSHISSIRRNISAAIPPVDAYRFCIARGADGRYRIPALGR